MTISETKAANLEESSGRFGDEPTIVLEDMPANEVGTESTTPT